MICPMRLSSWRSASNSRQRPRVASDRRGAFIGQPVRRHGARQPRQRRSRSAAVAPPHARQAQTAPPPIFREQLDDPAHIGASTTSSVPVQDRGDALSLHEYMTLPIEQYDEVRWIAKHLCHPPFQKARRQRAKLQQYNCCLCYAGGLRSYSVLDPAMIKSLGGNRYSLAVPRTSLFNVWVEPIVEVEVNLALTGLQRAVIIQATNWGLRGSDLVENLNLGRRFSLDFRAVLTWMTAREKAAQAGNGSVPAPPSNPAGAGPAEVQGHIDLDVYSEVLGPFKIIPRGVLEAGGNTVMGALVNNLLPVFLRRLVMDYERWATDDVYRQRRAQRADGERALRG